jgi:hypothetical protein
LLSRVEVRPNATHTGALTLVSEGFALNDLTGTAQNPQPIEE